MEHFIFKFMYNIHIVVWKKKYLLKRQVIPPTFKVIPTKIVLLHCLLESSELKNTIMLPSSNLMSTERDSLAWLIFCSTLNALLYGLSLMIYYQDFHFLNNFLSFSTLLPFWCKWVGINLFFLHVANALNHMLFYRLLSVILSGNHQCRFSNN